MRQPKQGITMEEKAMYGFKEGINPVGISREKLTDLGLALQSSLEEKIVILLKKLLELHKSGRDISRELYFLNSLMHSGKNSQERQNEFNLRLKKYREKFKKPSESKEEM